MLTSKNNQSVASRCNILLAFWGSTWFVKLTFKINHKSVCVPMCFCVYLSVHLLGCAIKCVVCSVCVGALCA